LYRSEGAEFPACSTTPASQVIEYDSNYAPGVVFKGSNGLCYTIANDGYQVTAPLINEDIEYGNCNECTETSPTTTTTTAPPTTTTTTTANTSYYTFSMTTGYATSGEVCLDGSSVTQIYGSNATFLSNTYFYNSPSLSSPYVGNGLFYKNTNTNQWVQIEFDGFNNGGGSC
jgi:hypothetical protein